MKLRRHLIRNRRRSYRLRWIMLRRDERLSLLHIVFRLFRTPIGSTTSRKAVSQNLVHMMNSWPFGVDSKSLPTSSSLILHTDLLVSLASNWFNYKLCLSSRFSSTTIIMSVWSRSPLGCRRYGSCSPFMLYRCLHYSTVFGTYSVASCLSLSRFLQYIGSTCGSYILVGARAMASSL